MPEKTAKPARKRATPRRTPAKTEPRARHDQNLEHEEIATRAYFIYLDEGHGDEVTNWLRAEGELTAV